MDKREKVVKGFEFCANDYYDCETDGCPYNDLYGKGCIGQMKLDAYELLNDPDRVRVVRCGNCRYWEPPSKEEVEDGCTYGRCSDTGAGADVNDFCSSGERNDA